MSLFKQFQMDDSKQQNGIDIKYGANDDGTVPTFRILRADPSNAKYAKILERETLPYNRQISLGTISPELAKKIYLRVFVLAVLVSWSNVQDQQGNAIPYNFDNAIKLFEELPELYKDLSEQSNKAAMFRLDAMDGDIKNS